MISVCVITYNHEKYIQKTLDSILAQITDYSYEIIIGEDGSTDSTRKICEAYASKYPKIKLFANANNIGVQHNLKQTLEQCSGKYIALCEGDDYWIFTEKLKIQVEFLEKNDEYSLCSSRYKIYNEKSNTITTDSFSPLFSDTAIGIDIERESMFVNWLCKTCTVVFRSSAFNTYLIKDFKLFRDVHLFYYVLLNGKGFCFNIETSIYTEHDNGIWSSKEEQDKINISLNVFKELYLQNKQDQTLKKMYANQILRYIDYQISLPEKKLHYSFIKAVLKYSMLTKAPGFIFLKLKNIL